MKLYEVNHAIEEIFDALVDTDTGEILMESDELTAKLDALLMER